MKKLKIIASLTILSLLLTMGVYSSPINLISNGGFEDGEISPWTTWGGGVIVSSGQRTGSHAGQLPGEGAFEQTVTGLASSTTYRLTGWGKLNDGSTGQLIIGVKDHGSPQQTAPAITSTTYQEGSLEFTTASWATSAKIFCFKYQGSGGAYCDDFTLEAVTVTPPVETNPTDNLQLIWNDEFDGNTLDATKWKPAPEWFRQGGSYWSDDNYEMTGNGQVKLSVSEENGVVYAGAIRTHQLFDTKYGYFEVRCKLPQIQGGWAAFWLMPYNNNPGEQGNDGTEIDVFESINGWNGQINHAIHWDGYGAEHQKDSAGFNRPDLYDDQYHTFGMLWTPDEYIFYIDDEESWRTSAGGVSDVNQYMKLTMEVTDGAWAGNWSNQVEKPIEWLVDYVRVYQSSAVTPTPTPTNTPTSLPTETPPPTNTALPVATDTPTPAAPLTVGLDTDATARSSSIFLLSVTFFLTFLLITWRKMS